MITVESKRRDKEQAARDKVQEDLLYYTIDNNLYLSRMDEALRWPLQVHVTEPERNRY